MTLAKVIGLHIRLLQYNAIKCYRVWWFFFWNSSLGYLYESMNSKNIKKLLYRHNFLKVDYIFENSFHQFEMWQQSTTSSHDKHSYESRNASSDISSPHFDMNEQIYWVSKLSSINIMKFQTPCAIWIWKGNWIFGHIFSLRMRQETARIKTFPPNKSTWMNRARIKKV